LTYIEASDKLIKEWLKSQTPEIRKYIIGEENEKQ
jgi:hypothetical protein